MTDFELNKISTILQEFAPISLDEMKVVKLMNRIDTKYVIPVGTLSEVLTRSAGEYLVQTNDDNERMAPYHTVYLDTPDKLMYTLHETGRATREKIRMRTYLDTNSSYLEVKDKNNHGRTTKKRILIPDMESIQENDKADDFLSKKARFSLNNLQPHLENEFCRITLVNKARTERLTIDLNLSFHNFDTDNRVSLDHIAIIELKRDGLSFSPMKDLLTRLQIREGGFSKYCLGCAMTNPELRQNNLKEKINRINKLKQE